MSQGTNGNYNNGSTQPPGRHLTPSPAGSRQTQQSLTPSHVAAATRNSRGGSVHGEAMMALGGDQGAAAQPSGGSAGAPLHANRLSATAAVALIAEPSAPTLRDIPFSDTSSSASTEDEDEIMTVLGDRASQHAGEEHLHTSTLHRQHQQHQTGHAHLLGVDHRHHVAVTKQFSTVASELNHLSMTVPAIQKSAITTPVHSHTGAQSNDSDGYPQFNITVEAPTLGRNMRGGGVIGTSTLESTEVPTMLSTHRATSPPSNTTGAFLDVVTANRRSSMSASSGSVSSNASIVQAQYAASIASSHMQPGGNAAGCWPFGKRQRREDIQQQINRVRRLRGSKTIRFFYRTMFLSLLILVPGIVFHVALPNLKLGGVPMLMWLATFSLIVFLYPFIRMILHGIFYHALPESAFENKMVGNWLFYASELTGYLAGLLWVGSNAVVWNYVWPTVTGNSTILTLHPLTLLNPMLGVLSLWISMFGSTRLLVIWWTHHFNQKAFLDRVREALFFDYVIETLREAKRRKKFLSRTAGDQLNAANVHRSSFLMPQSSELRRRAKHLDIPKSLVTDAAAVAAAGGKSSKFASADKITAHAWKRQLDTFYNVMLMDEHMLNELEGDIDEYDEEMVQAVAEFRRVIALQKANKLNTSHKLDAGHNGNQLSAYHHLHHFNFQRAQKGTLGSGKFLAMDDRASKFAGKLFMSLKREESAYLSVTNDVVPLFRPVDKEAMDQYMASDQRSIISSLRRFSRASTAIDVQAFKQDAIAKGVHIFFAARCENEQLSERELRDTIQRAFRERRRLVSGLSGMRNVIQKVGECVRVLLCGILIMITLSIFEMSSVNALMSFGSVMLSFAFLFGSSARAVFEAIIFLLVVHPYDVGDRIAFDGESYLVSKINLLTTVLEKWDGKLIYMPTSKLATIDLYNYRRSLSQAELMKIRITFNTPREKMEELSAVMTKFVESESADYQGKVGVSLDSFPDLESLIVNVSFTHRTNWQNYELYVMRRAKLFRTLVVKMKEVGIEWKPLPRSVTMNVADPHAFEQLGLMVKNVDGVTNTGTRDEAMLAPLAAAAYALPGLYPAASSAKQ